MSFKLKTNNENEAEIQFEEFSNFLLESGETIPLIRLGFCVFGKDPKNNPLIILHPALTGSPRAKINGAASQGDGWFNNCIGAGKFLDTNKFTIVCFDHIGGNGHSSSAEELRNYRNSLTFRDEVNLIAKMLYNYGVTKIHAVVGGSIGGGQALEWLDQENLEIRKVLDISGHCTVDSTASEFFAIQRDLLWAEGANIKKLSERLRNNHQDLLGSSPGFDFIFEHIGSELEKIQISYSPTKLLGVARQIGFLRFVTPTFFENKWQSYFDESKDTSLAFAKLRSWIDHQGEIFPKRFSAEALALLCHLDATATGKNPTEVAKLLINKNTQLTGFMVQGDVLFRAELQQQFYNQVKENLTEQHQHLCNAYQISDELNGHDHFLSDSFQHSVPGLKKYLES